MGHFFDFEILNNLSLTSEKKYDVVFAGTINRASVKDRAEFLRKLIQNGIKLKIFAKTDDPFLKSYCSKPVYGKDYYNVLKESKIVINTQFEEVSDFKNGKAVFKNGKQWGYIDTKGAYIINPQFDAAGFFSEEMAVILQGSNYGYISEKGEIIINPQFEDAGEFNSSLACVKSGETYGYINKDGKFEINPQFEKASSFFKDIAFVKTGDKWGVIDKEGKYIINPQFDAIKYYFETSSYVQSDYYDATTFIKKFFEKSGDNNSFDGFDANSTLQNIIDNNGDFKPELL